MGYNLLNLSNEMLDKAVVKTFMQESILFEKAPVISISGNAYSFNQVAEGFTVEKREMGQDVVNTQEMQTTKVTEPLAIHTASAKIDRAMQLVTETDLMSLEMELQAKAMGNAMQGEILTKVKADAGVKVNGLSEITVDEILDAVDGMIYNADSTVIFASPKTARKLTKEAQVGGFLYGKADQFGKIINHINGMALQPVKELTDNEVVVVYFNTVDGVTLATNGGVKTYNYVKGVFNVTDAEILACPVVKNTKAVAHLTVGSRTKTK